MAFEMAKVKLSGAIGRSLLQIELYFPELSVASLSSLEVACKSAHAEKHIVYLLCSFAKHRTWLGAGKCLPDGFMPAYP